MKTKKNVLTNVRKLALQASERISSRSDINETTVGNVNITVCCYDYLYRGIQSAII